MGKGAYCSQRRALCDVAGDDEDVWLEVASKMHESVALLVRERITTRSRQWKTWENRVVGDEEDVIVGGAHCAHAQEAVA